LLALDRNQTLQLFMPVQHDVELARLLGRLDDDGAPSSSDWTTSHERVERHLLLGAPARYGILLANKSSYALPCLLSVHGRLEAIAARLAMRLDPFTHGFPGGHETADLKETKALMRELA